MSWESVVRIKKTILIASLGFVVACIGSLSAQQAAVPASGTGASPAQPATIWDRLGVTQAADRLKTARESLVNRRGNFPGLEGKLPIKKLADAANLESPVPAIKKAAEIKQMEDMAPQKIKAIKYLAEMGCGCYDKDGAITDALVASLDDCSELVRLETVRSLADVACQEECKNCKTGSCCNPKLLRRLQEIVYSRDEYGCFKEPSRRVREVAKEALCCCRPRLPQIAPVIQESPPEDEENTEQETNKELPSDESEPEIKDEPEPEIKDESEPENPNETELNEDEVSPPSDSSSENDDEEVIQLDQDEETSSASPEDTSDDILDSDSEVGDDQNSDLLDEIGGTSEGQNGADRARFLNVLPNGHVRFRVDERDRDLGQSTLIVVNKTNPPSGALFRIVRSDITYIDTVLISRSAEFDLVDGDIGSIMTPPSHDLRSNEEVGIADKIHSSSLAFPPQSTRDSIRPEVLENQTRRNPVREVEVQPAFSKNHEIEQPEMPTLLDLSRKSTPRVEVVDRNFVIGNPLRELNVEKSDWPQARLVTYHEPVILTAASRPVPRTSNAYASIKLRETIEDSTPNEKIVERIRIGQAPQTSYEENEQYVDHCKSQDVAFVSQDNKEHLKSVIDGVVKQRSPKQLVDLILKDAAPEKSTTQGPKDLALHVFEAVSEESNFNPGNYKQRLAQPPSPKQAVRLIFRESSMHRQPTDSKPCATIDLKIDSRQQASAVFGDIVGQQQSEIPIASQDVISLRGNRRQPPANPPTSN